ncbi:LOW QUALITY PROTEIN: WD repeat-containing protein 90 [Dasypus novemcinctus]|uniref:LOW QUALITY PROTEIN: WD repeat-containing protein 90 n=1 Tax=Dasypus novemcinctus TaxID=9361 RepID=UPI00265E3B7D|nr:LOW QUALITY PROTEIN: WD repeat-containing protein 90 [Dasypus novemcinctus]
MARAWQHPFLNVFRHFRVDEWKRSTKEGDVAAVMDRTLKSTVYRIRGSVSAGNYIQLPKTSTQSLGLTGRYLYVLFRPLPTKHFVIHLDVSTEDSQVIRVSFSSLFKEFKSTATWLQFPFVCEARPSGQELGEAAPPGVRWTCLQLDLLDILLIYLNRRYGHLKSVRLCANLLVRNLYTSDLSFDPAVTVTEARRRKLAVTPIPREMGFPVPKGERWHDRYVHIRFPGDGSKAPELVPRSCSPPGAALLRPVAVRKQVPNRASSGVRISSPVAVSAPQVPGDGAGRGGPDAGDAPPLQPLWAPEVPRPPSEGSLACRGSEGSRVGGPGGCGRVPLAWAQFPDRQATGKGVHRFAPSPAVEPEAREDGVCEPPGRKQGRQQVPLSKKPSPQKGFLPDPVLKLKGVIGFGGHSTRWALWTQDGAAVVYPCHAVIIALHVETREQRFFLGHTDKVSSLALDERSSLLASAQVQPPSMLRLWDFGAGTCLSLFRSPVHSIGLLSFSSSGTVLCGVGRDSHGRTMVVAWSTGRVGHGGEVAVLAKAYTDADVQAFEVAFFDDTRMVSCGRGSVRLWRLRGGGLRSCPVDLGEHHALDFTGLAFERSQDGQQAPLAPALLVCSRSGHVLEIDCQRLAVRRARRLLPAQPPGGPPPQKPPFSSGPGVPVSSLSVARGVCAVGSEDGYLRLWPLDFSSVLLEAEHEGPVGWVRVSPDGLRVLSTTSAGQLGFLDVPAREYSVLARAHAGPVLAFATERSRGQLATVSQDASVRVWDLATLQQLYDFAAPDETPQAVAFHPSGQALFCGFSSGVLRAFSLDTLGVLGEHRCHRGAVTGLAATPDGRFLFSSCSQGGLAQYNCIPLGCCVLRAAGNMVSQEAGPSPHTLAVSGDSHLLAFVGPSKYTVTVVATASLDVLLRVNVSTLDAAGSSLDSAVAICFSPAPTRHLLVATSAGQVLVLDAESGRVVRELSAIRPAACSSLALSEDARFLLTAGDWAVRVWDYPTRAGPGCQVYIGHSEPVRGVAFTPDQRQVLSVGDTVFLWDVLATPVGTPEGSVHGSAGAPPPAEAGAGQQEDLLSGAHELPRRLVPVPSQASPPQLDLRAGHPAGSDGVFSVSDEEGSCEENPGRQGSHQATSPPTLVEKGSGGGGASTRGSAGEPWALGLPCFHPSQPSSQGTSKAEAVPAIRPDSYKHFTARFKASACPQSVPFSLAGGEQLRLKAVVGYNGNGRANMVWRPETGFFAYSCGCLVVVEDLHSGLQQHWPGHPEEISTLALSHGAQVLASASVSSSTAAKCQIRIWAVPGGSCQRLISHHSSAVQALAFSPDDRLLFTLGDYRDCTLALWSTATYTLVARAHLLEPTHSMACGPGDACGLACVGQAALTFWLPRQRGPDVHLQVHREPVPEEVGAGELTALCFSSPPLLYCGSNAGQICVWDTGTRRCFLTWGADDGEIGVLLCSGARLVSGSNTKRLRLWAVGAVPELRLKGSGARSSSVFMEREVALDGAVVSAAFDDSMDMGVAGSSAGTLWYVSWAEGSSTRLVSGHRSRVNEVAFSPGGSRCATGGEDGSVRVWSLASMELVIQFQVLNQSCLCLAWSPPSCGHPELQRVVAGYSDGTLRVFRVSRTEMELKMHPHPVALTAVAFSTDGQTLLSGDKDGLVAVSRPRTGMTVRVLSDHRGAPISTLQSTRKEDGDFGVQGADLWLAASGDQRVSVWASDWPKDRCELVDWLSFPAPAPLEPSRCPPPTLAAFCPWDRGLLVCAGLGRRPEVLLYSLHQKQVVETIPLPFFAVSLSLSPGARLLAVGFAERVLRLVDCASGTAQDVAAHADSVHLCRFTPSARLLFTAAHNELLVWEATGPGGHRGTPRPGTGV